MKNAPIVTEQGAMWALGPHWNVWRKRKSPTLLGKENANPQQYKLYPRHCTDKSEGHLKRVKLLALI